MIFRLSPIRIIRLFWFLRKYPHKKKSLRNIILKLSVRKEAATYSPALHCSTIGASRLNFSVRNGKRWNPAAITT